MLAPWSDYGEGSDEIPQMRREALNLGARQTKHLFLGRGDGTFADRAVESSTVMGRWAWGSLFVDVNNDGWKDIYVTNGFVTADNNNDL